MSMVRDIFTQTLQFIKQHQDGETAELLRYRGLQYNMMYGVSSAILYSYAKKLEKNQELADMLWKEDFREAKLLALMLSEDRKSVVVGKECRSRGSAYNC